MLVAREDWSINTKMQQSATCGYSRDDIEHIWTYPTCSDDDLLTNYSSSRNTWPTKVKFCMQSYKLYDLNILCLMLAKANWKLHRRFSYISLKHLNKISPKHETWQWNALVLCHNHYKKMNSNANHTSLLVLAWYKKYKFVILWKEEVLVKLLKSCPKTFMYFKENPTIYQLLMRDILR